MTGAKLRERGGGVGIGACIWPELYPLRPGC